MTGSIQSNESSYTLDYSRTPFSENPRVAISQWYTSAVVYHIGRNRKECPFRRDGNGTMSFEYIIIGKY